jgi:hypothetical protein
MSIWTHVVGNILVDGFPKLNGNYTIEHIKKLIGPTNLYHENNPESTLPSGSEGSLNYRIIEYGTGLPWLSIPIWGDLRDFEYEDVGQIEVWFDDLLGKLDTIRGAVLCIETEGQKPIILTGKL